MSRSFQPAAFLLLLLVASVGCRPGNVQVAFSATVPHAQVRNTAQQPANTPVPTADRRPSRTPTPIPTDTPTITPTVEPTATPTATPNITAIPINSPTRGVESTTDPHATPLPTWTPPPDDPATRIDDHYRMQRPIAEGNTNWADRTYPYGGTQGGRLQTHHGVDIANPRGIPVLAVADGTVYYAGDDLTIQYGSILNYYGRLVVIEHDFTASDGRQVYSLYGHLARWDVEAGQRVGTGDQIGLVGDLGVALGPHLHFEVRLGDPTSFDNTYNPELWIYPFGGFGTLAGRVTDAAGNRLYSVTIQVRSPNVNRNAFTYADDSVNSDPVFGENFTLGDLPAGYYDVSVTADGDVKFRRTIYVYRNRTTWIDIQLED